MPQHAPVPDPGTHCANCHAQLHDPSGADCPYCGAPRWLAPPSTSDLPPLPTPWTGQTPYTPNPWGEGHTPHTPGPWTAGHTPYPPGPWTAGHTPTPYPMPSAPPGPSNPSNPPTTGDIAWSSTTPTPASWPPGSASRPPIDHSVTHANLFEGVPAVQTSSTDLYVVGKDSARRISSSPPESTEAMKLVIVPRTTRSEEIIRGNTVGQHINLSRTVVGGRPSWVVSGLEDSKANLLVVRLKQVGLSAESIFPEHLDPPEAPTNIRYLGTIAVKAVAAAVVAFFLTIFFAADYVSPVIGRWTLGLQASLRSAVGMPIDRPDHREKS